MKSTRQILLLITLLSTILVIAQANFEATIDTQLLV